MSFTRKILDSARMSINTVMERISADDTPLSHVDEAALQRELEHRIAAREANPRNPGDNPRARLADSSEESRKRRLDLARQRAERARAAREQRERAKRAEQEEFFRRARPAPGAARPASPGAAGRAHGASSGGTRGASGSSSRGFPFHRKDDKIAEYYKVMDLPYGAEFSEVKTAYRRLMRKYHPDRHAGNPKKQKAATELTMRVTQAYNALEEHLKGRRSS